MTGLDASPLAERGFEAIEAAVLETARGRWFLAEYSRRNRTADTRALLDAISRLEGALTGRHVSDDLERLRSDLSEMGSAIQRMKSEVTQLAAPPGGSRRLVEASETLDGIVRTTEIATSSILDATEHIQEAAWSMREQGADAALCDALDHRATEIYAACEFQDLTAQRTAKVVQMLGFLEGRIAAMSRAWGAETEPAGPPGGRRDELGLTQSDIDFVIVDAPRPAPQDDAHPPSLSGGRPPDETDGTGARTSDPPSAGPAPVGSVMRPGGGATLAEIDRLGIAERLRLFT